MATEAHHGATIIAFPSRHALSSLHRRDAAFLEAPRETKHRAAVIPTSAGYHEAALQEADRTRKP